MQPPLLALRQLGSAAVHPQGGSASSSEGQVDLQRELSVQPISADGASTARQSAAADSDLYLNLRVHVRTAEPNGTERQTVRAAANFLIVEREACWPISATVDSQKRSAPACCISPLVSDGVSPGPFPTNRSHSAVSNPLIGWWPCGPPAPRLHSLRSRCTPVGRCNRPQLRSTRSMTAACSAS